MGSESLKLTFNLLTVTGYKSSLALYSVTSVFRHWSASEFSGFCVFFENDKTDFRHFFFRV